MESSIRNFRVKRFTTWLIIGVLCSPFVVGVGQMVLESLGLLNKEDGWPIGPAHLSFSEWCFNIWTTDLLLGVSIVCSVSTLIWLFVKHVRSGKSEKV